MAKSDAFFGIRRGSTKSLTFSVFNGKQVTKDRVGKPRNPQTNPQMEQRMRAAGASKFYQTFQEILSNSFESIEYGTKSMWHFWKLYMRERQNVPYPRGGSYGLKQSTTGYVINNDATTVWSISPEVKVSQGTLTPLSYGIIGNSLVLYTEGYTINSEDANKLIGGGGGKMSLLGAKWKDIREFFAKAWPSIATATGQITVMLNIIELQLHEDSDIKGTYTSIPKYYRIPLWIEPTTDETTVQQMVNSNNNFRGIEFLSKYLGNDYTQITGKNYITLFSWENEEEAAELYMGHGGAIASRWEDGRWRRSEQRLLKFNDQQWKKLQERTLQDSINTYLVSKGIYSEEYLNNENIKIDTM